MGTREVLDAMGVGCLSSSSIVNAVTVAIAITLTVITMIRITSTITDIMIQTNMILTLVLLL